MEKIEERVRYLNGHLRQRLEESGVRLLSDYPEENRSALTFIPGDERLLERLQANHIIASLRGNGIRLSLHFYNSEEEIEKLLEQV
jgi:selenocysteine lyase/cysteine desulfurase